jgi:hypothetical protein
MRRRIVESNKNAGKKSVKAPEETTVGKTAAKKTPAKKTAAIAEEVPASEEKKTAAEKTPGKKSTEPKKTTGKKKEPKVSFFLEYSGKQIAAEEVLEAVKKDYLSKHKDALVKTLEIYIKPEENTAYYAIDGEGSEEHKILL